MKKGMPIYMNRKVTMQFTALTFGIALISWGICILLGQFNITIAAHYWVYLPYLLGGFSPAIASYVILKRNKKIDGFKEWIRNIFHVKNPIRFYMLVILLNAVGLVPQIIMNGTKEMNPLYLFIPLIPLMLFGGGLEEAGWRYILQPSLDKNYGYFLSCVMVAVVWSVWHLPLFFIQGTSQYSSDFWLFAINVLGLTFALGAIRKITGNVFLCVLFHCINNAGSVTFNLRDTLPGNSVTTALLIVISAAAVFFYKRHNYKCFNKPRPYF